MKLTLALEMPGTERAMRLQRDQQTASDAWLRQMETAMLAQPPAADPHHHSDKGRQTAHDDATSGSATAARSLIPAAASSASPLSNAPESSSSTSETPATRSLEPHPHLQASTNGWRTGTPAKAEPVSSAQTMQVVSEASAPPPEAELLTQSTGISPMFDAKHSNALAMVLDDKELAAAFSFASSPSRRLEISAQVPADHTSIGARPPSSTSMVGGAWMRAGAPPINAEGAGAKPATGSKDTASSRQFAEPLAKRQMHLAHDGDQVSVTIRDAALGGTEQWGLIGRLSVLMQMTGMNLRAVTINGDRRVLTESHTADTFGQAAAQVDASNRMPSLTTKGNGRGR